MLSVYREVAYAHEKTRCAKKDREGRKAHDVETIEKEETHWYDDCT
jgi:hypothetical protein